MNNHVEKRCKHEPGRDWEKGCCTENRTVSNSARESNQQVTESAFEGSLVTNSYKERFERLLDWCKIVRDCLDAEQIEDAKFFLKQVLSDIMLESFTTNAENRKHVGEGINPFS